MPCALSVEQECTCCVKLSEFFNCACDGTAPASHEIARYRLVKIAVSFILLYSCETQ